MIPSVVKLTRGVIYGVALLHHDWENTADRQLAGSSGFYWTRPAQYWHSLSVMWDSLLTVIRQIRVSCIGTDSARTSGEDGSSKILTPWPDSIPLVQG